MADDPAALPAPLADPQTLSFPPSAAPATSSPAMADMADPNQAAAGKLIALQKKHGGDDARIAGQEAKDLTEDKARALKAFNAEGVTIDEIGKQAWNADQEMQKREHSPMENFGSLGSIIAIAASAFTHTSAISAFNAAAAYNEAVKNNDNEAYNKAYDAFKENAQLMIKRAGLEHERYEDAFKMVGVDMNIANARARAAAASFNDQKTLIMLEATGGLGPVMQAKEALYDASVKVQGDLNLLDENRDKLNYVYERSVVKDAWGKPKKDPKTGIVIQDPAKHRQAREDYDSIHATKDPEKRAEAEAYVKFKQEYRDSHDGQEPTSEAMTEFQRKQAEAKYAGHGGGRAGRSPESIKAIVKAIKSGDQPPVLTGLYGAAPDVKAGLEQDDDTGPKMNVTEAMLEWERAKAAVRAVNSPQMTRYIGLATSVKNTIDEVKDLADLMDQSGIPAYNALKLKQYIELEGNSEKGQLAARYIGAVNTLKEEFANLAQGGYAPTESVWHLANRQISENYGVRELGASLTEIRRLIGYRLNAIPNINTLGPGAPDRYLPSGGGSNQSDPLGIR